MVGVKILESWLLTLSMLAMAACSAPENSIEVKTAREAAAANCEQTGKCIKDPSGLVLYNSDLVTENLVLKRQGENQTLLTKLFNLIDEPKLLVTAEKLEPLMRGVAIVGEFEPCDSPKGIDGANPTAGQLRSLRQGRYKACITYVGEGFFKKAFALAPIDVDTTPPEVSKIGVAHSAVTATTAALTWTRAGDNLTLEGKLIYSVYTSRTNVLDSLDAVRTHGNLVPGLLVGGSSYTITSLSENANYHAAVVVTDEAGNQSLVGNTNFQTTASDTTPPSLPSILINAAATHTSSTASTLTLSAGEASEMYVTNTDGCASSGAWEAYGTSKSWTLGQTNSTATVYAKFRDLAGNETACVSDTITHDDMSPLAPNLSGVTPTNDTTPTWTWSGDVNDGNGTYRYKLNDSNLSAGFTETTSPSFTPSQSLPEGEHTLYVQERDAAGNWSESGIFAIQVVTPPAVPTLLTPTRGLNSLDLSWASVATATSYNLYWSTTPDVSTISTKISDVTSTYIHSSLTDGQTYYYRLAAAKDGVESGLSNEVSGTPDLLPESPTNIVGAPENFLVNLSWDEPAGNGGTPIVDYIIQYSDNGGSSWTTFDDGYSTSTAVAVTGLTNGTAYLFRVAAGNSAGTGPYSTPSAGVTPAFPCPANYVKVQANATLGTSEFCVAKYEMKNNGSNVAVSQAAGVPWADIARDGVSGAIAKCQALSTSNLTYDLISNSQWQAIAREIETAQSPIGTYLNWSNNTTSGSNYLNRGHSDIATNSTTTGALAASTDDDPCFGTGNSSCADNTHTDFTQKRTHTLKSGEIIWDVAGNVWEVVKDSNSASQGTTSYVSTNSWSDITRLKFGPEGNYATKDSGEFGGLGRGELGLSANAVVRGGDYHRGTWVGVFASSLGVSGTSLGWWLGFRCVLMPEPSAPILVSGTTDETQVALTWDAPISNGVSAITDYVVQYSSDGGSTWTTFNDSASTTTSVTVTGLVYGTSYVFRVAAVNAAGTGNFSSTSVVAGDYYFGAQDLAIGTERQGPDGTILALVEGASGFKVWKEKDGNRILNATGLLANGWQKELTRAGTGFSATEFTGDANIAGRVCPPNVFLSHSDMIATNRCLYYDAVNAAQKLDEAGTSGTEASDWLQHWNRENTGRGTGSSYYEGNIQTCADKGMRLPTAYETTMNTPGSWLPTGDGISPTWARANGVPSSGRTWTASASTTTTTTSYWKWEGTISNASTSTLDFANLFWVRCVLPNYAEDNTTPGAPTSVAGVAGDTQITLTWTAPENNGGSAITDYVVQYSSDSGSSWTTFSDGTSTSTSATVTDLVNWTSYIFRVAAVNSSGTGAASSNSVSITPQSAYRAAGGTVSECTTTGGVNYVVHTFTSTGTSTFTVASSGSSLSVDYLIVGGGGAGGSNYAGGGGGAGGFLTGTGVSLASGSSNTIIVGQGGTSVPGVNAGNNGGDSTALGLTAFGGGGGGSGNDGTDPGGIGIGGNVGSGGGGGGGKTSGGTGGSTTNTTQGKNGGNGRANDTATSRAGAGGGGAAAAGTNPTNQFATRGGNGIGSSYGNCTTTLYYGAGGGGGSVDAAVTTGSSGGSAPSVVGGRGGTATTVNGGDATVNTGSGGGGAGLNGQGGNGSDGIVIIRYVK